MRIVFMGTPDFAVGTLKALIGSGHEVAAVITQPDKPKGRGKAMQATPVKEAALEAGIPVYQPRKVRDPEFIEQFRQLKPDAAVVVAFGQIIPQAILDIPKHGCINVHGSLLPKYRGAAPIQWAVIDGEKESGVTTMRMDAGLDTGDMILKAVVPLDEKETGGSLFDKLSRTGADLLLETLDKIEDGTAVYEKQGESTTAYAAMLKKDQGLIDWSKDAVSIERLIRGLNPWPSAYTHLDGKTLKIWAADVEESEPEVAEPEMTEPEVIVPKVAGQGCDCKDSACGTVTEVTKKDFRVKTGNGILIIKELQPEGKKRMSADAFLRGYHLEAGTVLE